MFVSVWGRDGGVVDLSSMWCSLENHEIVVVVVKGIIFEGCVIMESCVKF